MPYHVRVSSSVAFSLNGSLNFLTQSQFFTGSRKTSPASHNPGLADRPALRYSLALGCPGDSPVVRNVKSIPQTSPPAASKLIFTILTLFMFPRYYRFRLTRKIRVFLVQCRPFYKEVESPEVEAFQSFQKLPLV